jgi:hypothetical protein
VARDLTEPTEAPAAVSPRRRRWRHWPALLLAAVLLALAWTAAAGALLASARGDLLDARAAMEQAQAGLADADIAGAAAAFARAEEAFARAARRTGNPIVRLAERAPAVGGDVRVARSLAGAGRLVAEAGVEVTGAVARAPDGLGAFAPREGAIPLEPLRALHPPLARARDLLDRAAQLVADPPATVATQAAAEAHIAFSAQLVEAIRMVEVAEGLVRVLPSFLGGDGPQRYLFGASTPAELRGTGGFVGAYATLTADAGRLSFSDFHAASDLPVVPVEEIEAPNPSFAARYNRHGGAGFWPNINMTPDFPSAAVAMTRLYERVTGEAVDGVIVADPFALAALLQVSGPAEIPGVGAVTSDTVVPFVTSEAYRHITDPDERKQLLGRVAAGSLQRFLAGGGDVEKAARAVADAATGGHLLVWSADAGTQRAFAVAGIDGALPDSDGDFLGVFANNASASKVDYYLERAVTYDVWLGADGMAVGRVAVELANHAPTEGHVAYVIGSDGPPLAVGENAMLLDVFCAPGCAVSGFRRDLGDAPLGVGEELGLTVASSSVRLRSGERETLRYDLEIPRAWEWRDGEAVYSLVFGNQTSIRPQRLRVRVHQPDGFHITATSAGMTIDDDAAIWEGEPERMARIAVHLTPSGRPSFLD